MNKLMNWAKKPIAIAFSLSLLVTSGSFASLANESSHEDNSRIINGDFETGDLTGWTLIEGEIGVVSNAVTYWGDRNFFKQGNYFLSGAEKEGDAGVLRSSSFELAGDGYIAFLIGAASSEGKGCVKLYKETPNGDELVKVYTNTRWSDPATGNTLLRIYDCFFEEIGETFHFEIVNGSEPGFSFINADDFRTSLTKAEVEALYEEDANRVSGIYDSFGNDIKGLYKDSMFYGTDDKVGEGANTSKIYVNLPESSKEEMVGGIAIDIAGSLKNKISVVDSFGITKDFNITINGVSKDGKSMDADFSKLYLSAGSYEISYSVNYNEEGENKSLSADYELIVTETEASEQIINGDFETGDFTGWTLMDGGKITNTNNSVGIISDEETYWGTRNIYKHGAYCLRGDSKENLSGKIRSSNFILGKDGYISFMIGAAAKESRGCIKLYAKADKEDELVKTYINENWSDPKTGLTLLRVFDKIDPKYLGREMYFVIENGSEAGFSFINADDFRTSLSYEEVLKLQEQQLDEIAKINDEHSEYVIKCYRKNGIINDIIVKRTMPDIVKGYAGVKTNLKELISDETKIVKSYSLEEIQPEISIEAISYNEKSLDNNNTSFILEPGNYKVEYSISYDGKSEHKSFTLVAEAVDKSKKDIENGDFETGDLSGWELINPSVFNKDIDGSPLGVVSAETYWNEKLTYNQSGDYHLDGWKVTDNEAATWGVRSSVFTLAGAGVISVKMGGNSAGFSVFKLDGTLVGEYNQTRFSDKNFPYVDEGGSWADMGRYFIDLHDYLGETLYIELHDRAINGGWAAAFFDDVQTYYETKPDILNGYDEVTAPVRGEEGNMEYNKVKIPWTLLGYEKEVMRLSFEEDGFEIVNSVDGTIGTYQSVLRNPKFQDEPVLPARIDGVSGKALNFDGYSNYVEFDEDVSGSVLTVDAYVCPRAFMWDGPSVPRTEQIAQVIAGSYNQGAKRGFLLGITKHGYLTLRVGSQNAWYSITSDDGKKIPLYEFSRVTGVFDGINGEMSLYINDKPAGKTIIEKNQAIVASGLPVRIAKGSEPVIVADDIFDGTMFPGYIDEVTILKTALSADEVMETGLCIPNIPYENTKAPTSNLENDYYRPVFHATPPASWMNEPHALFNYNNKWHLFYQTNQAGPYWHNISWGHWVSDDMVNWEAVSDAVVPNDETVSPDGVWTGNVIFSSDGKPFLLITAGDDSRPINGSNQHVGLAKCTDYSDPKLTNWEIIGFAVTQDDRMGTAGEFRDAQAFGIGNDRYMVVGGAKDGKGMAHIFKTTAKSADEWTKESMDWQYMGNVFGDFFDNNLYKKEYGTVWEMPNIVPLKDEKGKDTGKYLFVFSPQHGDNDVWYYIGSFDKDTCRFTPDFAEAKLMDYGNNIYTGPTVYLNPSDGKTYICGIMQENATGDIGRPIEDHMASGWAFYAALPRELFLKKDGSLGIKHINTASAEGETLVKFKNLSVEAANEVLKNVSGECLKIDFEVKDKDATVGMYLKESDSGASKLYLTKNSLGLDKQSGAYDRGDVVKGTVYLDKCSVEAYIDNSICISGSKFFKGQGLSVFGGDSTKWTMTITAMGKPVKVSKPSNKPNNGSKPGSSVIPGNGQADNATKTSGIMEKLINQNRPSTKKNDKKQLSDTSEKNDEEVNIPEKMPETQDVETIETDEKEIEDAQIPNALEEQSSNNGFIILVCFLAVAFISGGYFIVRRVILKK